MNITQTVILILLVGLAGFGIYALLRKKENPEEIVVEVPERYRCVTYAGGGSGCVQDDDGPFATAQECAANCQGPETKTETVITTVPYYYGLPEYTWRTGYPYYYGGWRGRRWGPRPGPRPFPRGGRGGRR